MAVHPAPRLRDDLEALTALVQRAARHLKIDQAFVKGGTSLSRVYHLTNRFSEDADLLIPFPDVLGTGTRDRALKQIVAAAQEHLGLPDNRCLLQTLARLARRPRPPRHPNVAVNDRRVCRGAPE